MSSTWRFILGAFLLCLAVQAEVHAPPERENMYPLLGLEKLSLPEVPDLEPIPEPKVTRVVLRKNAYSYPPQGQYYTQPQLQAIPAATPRPTFMDKTLDKIMDVPGNVFDRVVPFMEGVMAAYGKLRGSLGGGAGAGRGEEGGKSGRKSLLPLTETSNKQFEEKRRVIHAVLAELEEYLKSDTSERMACTRIKR